jgi:hypothetical protein
MGGANRSAGKGRGANAGGRAERAAWTGRGARHAGEGWARNGPAEGGWIFPFSFSISNSYFYFYFFYLLFF